MKKAGAWVVISMASKFWGGIDDIPAIAERMGREGRKPQRLIVTKSVITGEEVQRLLRSRRNWASAWHACRS